MYKENKDITLQYYNQNAGSFVSGTVHADLTDTLNRFLSRLEPGAAILDFGCGSGDGSTLLSNMESLKGCETADISRISPGAVSRDSSVIPSHFP